MGEPKILMHANWVYDSVSHNHALSSSFGNTFLQDLLQVCHVHVVVPGRNNRFNITHRYNNTKTSPNPILSILVQHCFIEKNLQICSLFCFSPFFFIFLLSAPCLWRCALHNLMPSMIEAWFNLAKTGIKKWSDGVIASCVSWWFPDDLMVWQMVFQRRQWDASEITASSGPRQACQDHTLQLHMIDNLMWVEPSEHLWTPASFFLFVLQNFWRANAKLSFFWMLLHSGFHRFLHFSIFDASEVSESRILHGLKQTCIGIEARRKKDCVLCAMEFADCCLANSRHKTTVLFWSSPWKSPSL